eukprot:TRINITY_DN398_c0_g1_i1.p1 TRINITY_DN398_c0_g1~~TRINITY_DN398_c0_g1_i1.p1  ORF type:complete len:403 (+),score=84.52 TRINITY_DN398_c0_g1_i1:415-1623(+)
MSKEEIVNGTQLKLYIEDTYILSKKYKEKASLIYSYFKETQFNDIVESIDSLYLIGTDQLKVVAELKREVVLAYKMLRSDVEKLQDKYIGILVDLETVFVSLKNEAVEDCLYEDTKLQESYITHSLYDWVHSEDINQLQKEAYKEISALKKLISFLDKSSASIERKFEFLSSEFQSVNTSIKFPSSVGDDQISLYNTITSGVMYLASCVERIKSQNTQDLSTQRIVTEKHAVGTKLQEIYTSLIELEKYSDIMNEKKAEASDIFLGLNEMIDMMVIFKDDIQDNIQRIGKLRKKCLEHEEGYSGLFSQLTALTEFYSKFSEAYDEMLKEINRRKTAISHYERMIQRYQNELSEFHKTEERARENFGQTWGEYLPPTICPSLRERLDPPVIYPSFIKTNLPPV